MTKYKRVSDLAKLETKLSQKRLAIAILEQEVLALEEVMATVQRTEELRATPPELLARDKLG